MQGKSAVKNKINCQQIAQGDRLDAHQFFGDFRKARALPLVGDIRIALCQYDFGVQRKQQSTCQEDAQTQKSNFLKTR